MDNLFNEFEIAEKESWLAKIEADAKGKSTAAFDWKINDTLSQSPFSHKSDRTDHNSSIQRSGSSNHWKVGEQITVLDFDQSNKQIIAALENGVNALYIKLNTGISRSDFDLLFKDVNFTFIQTYFVIEDEIIAKAIVENLIRFCKENGLELALVDGGIYQTTQACFNSPRLYLDYKNQLPNFSFATVAMDDLFGYTETVVHEVSSVGVGLIELLESPVEYDNILVTLNIGKSYLLNIAKVRAAHILINNVLLAYKSEAKILTNAKLAYQSISENENQNLIQFTSQAMSAVIGGVDSLVLPASDTILASEESDFRKRLSRNVQSIMQMESFMGMVIDPAAGSYYIEKLTDQIAEQSWSYIQKNS